MSLPRIVGFSGSPRRPSKTRSLVETVAAEVASHQPVRLEIYDLSDTGPGLGAALQRQDLTLPAARIIDAIEQADALIIGTPVYKGAYTGLFKHALDLVDPRALVGKPVLLTATGGGPRHALVWNMRCGRSSASSKLSLSRQPSMPAMPTSWMANWPRLAFWRA
jgi:FMN reductase